MAARRREVGGHRFAAQAVNGGRSSKLGAATGGPGRKGCWDPWSVRNCQPGPALSLFLYSLRLLLVVVGRGADAGAVPALFRAGHAPPDPEPQPRP